MSREIGSAGCPKLEIGLGSLENQNGKGFLEGNDNMVEKINHGLTQHRIEEQERPGGYSDG